MGTSVAQGASRSFEMGRRVCLVHVSCYIMALQSFVAASDDPSPSRDDAELPEDIHKLSG